MARLTVSNLRASLSSDNASSLIFLHDVWDIAEAFKSKRAELHGGHHGPFAHGFSSRVGITDLLLFV